MEASKLIELLQALPSNTSIYLEHLDVEEDVFVVEANGIKMANVTNKNYVSKRGKNTVYILHS